MKIVIIDTSALIRFYIPDGALPGNLEESIHSAWRGESTIMAPELLLAEAAQVLLKKEKSGFLQPQEADDILASILELPIDFLGHHKILSKASELARQNNLTVYDALFLALAHQEKAQLITCDHKLEKISAKLLKQEV